MIENKKLSEFGKKQKWKEKRNLVKLRKIETHPKMYRDRELTRVIPLLSQLLLGILIEKIVCSKLRKALVHSTNRNRNVIMFE